MDSYLAEALLDGSLDPSVVRLIPETYATKYTAIPVARSGATVTLAMADPRDVLAVDDIQFMTGLHVAPVAASASAIRSAIRRYLATDAEVGALPHPGGEIERTLREFGRIADGGERLEFVTDAEDLDAATLDGQGNEVPIVRLVNAVVLSAIQKCASDIHIEPFERELRVRFRVDGQLQVVMTPPLRYRDAIVSRIKIMARLDIAEKRLPQDGRIKARFVDRGRMREIDLRVSILPTLCGEKVALRVLNPDAIQLDMSQLGFETSALERFVSAVRQPWGLVLVTGPTGSGKTSTLYSSLAQINRPNISIMTAEDPVEFNLAGINQVQIRENIGLSFAHVLRAFLRQDPNVILVGEIRDGETAAIAVKAALTGHLVLSTVHTNDAPGSVNRLVNMGIEPFLVAGSVSLVAAQRLVRRICESCKEPARVDVARLLDAGFSPEEAETVQPHHGRGCGRCSGSGYKGRIGLFEVMPMSDELRELVAANASTARLRGCAVAEGMSTLRQSGLRKVREGHSTLEEVIRETM